MVDGSHVIPNKGSITSIQLYSQSALLLTRTRPHACRTFFIGYMLIAMPSLHRKVALTLCDTLWNTYPALLAMLIGLSLILMA
jgi:hypothetical protein